MKKKILQIVLLLILPLSLTGQCPDAGLVVLKTQMQIDTFLTNYPNCTEINNRINIDGENSDITSLTPLSNLTVIESGLIIQNCAQLLDLQGLHNLTSIGGLHIESNLLLDDLLELSNITEMVGGLRIENSNLIKDLQGLHNLTSIGGLYIKSNLLLDDLLELSNITEMVGGVYIENSNQIKNLQGLHNLTSLGGKLTIESNLLLEDISALSNLTAAPGGILISDNPNLITIEGLFASPFITEDLLITKNAKLESISGFAGLTEVEEDFEISDNPLLSTLSGFEALWNAHDFTISKLPELSNFSAFNELDSIFSSFEFTEMNLANISAFGSLNDLGDVYIEKNPFLVSVDNLIPNQLRGDLYIKNNTNLTDIQALSSLSRVPRGFYLTDNDALTNVNSVSNIKEIGNLIISGNSLLVDLSGFQGLDTVGFLVLDNNGGIKDMTGFSSLKDAFGIRLEDFGGMDSLVSLDGLQGLTSLNRLTVKWAPKLLSLQGLENIISMERCELYDLPMLQDLMGLEDLETIDHLLIRGCDVLESFHGLEKLAEISSSLGVVGNDKLEDISALENIHLAQELDTLTIFANGDLSICAYENICEYLFLGGAHKIGFNGVGCNTYTELIDVCLANQAVMTLQGKVWNDVNPNCLPDSSELGFPNALLQLQRPNNTIYTLSSDSAGNFDFLLLKRDYNVKVISPSIFWTPCFGDSLITSSGVNDTIQTDFYLQPFGDCPFVDWTLNLSPLRVCGTRVATLDMCNYGTLPAEDFLFTITLGEFVSLESASVPYTTNSNGDILFSIDSLGVIDCNTIELNLFTECNNEIELNDILCLNVKLMGDALCAPDSTWDGSTTRVSGYCDNDSIYFELENIGTGDMANPASFMVDILIEDIVLLLDGGNYQLLSGEKRTLAYEADGNGFHLQADQTQGHPSSSTATTTVPNCEEMANDIVLTFFPSNDGDPFSQTFCTFVVNSYDPNVKSAFPIGTGEEHFIDKDWKLDYTVQFQNTGNDVAYQVIVRDTISENLDLSTLRVQGASHDFTWALNADRELVFTFDNINLPDSTSNEPASHGMLSYTILPHQDILPGALIENSAAIYFDFNDPIITNTVFHTIRKPVVASSEIITWCAGDLYNGLAIWNDTILLEIIEFTEYDSVHMTNLQVVDNLQGEVFVEVEIGTYFEQIEILGDTIFNVLYPVEQGCDSLVVYHISALKVGMQDLKNTFDQVRVFPNPATNILFVDPPKNIKLQEWSLTNLLGVAVWEKTFTSPASLIPISLQAIPAGVYYLQARGSGDRKVWKLVVN